MGPSSVIRRAGTKHQISPIGILPASREKGRGRNSGASSSRAPDISFLNFKTCDMVAFEYQKETAMADAIGEAGSKGRAPPRNRPTKRGMAMRDPRLIRQLAAGRENA